MSETCILAGEECPDCHGQGVLPNRKPCRLCYGRGEVTKRLTIAELADMLAKHATETWGEGTSRDIPHLEPTKIRPDVARAERLLEEM